MKVIKIKQLILQNFKGIKDLNINFSDITNIFGENGTGKTTIQDAFTFLLFDKDSKDSAKFDVQPLDGNNNPIHNLETVIEATLNLDGKDLIIKRIYKEKYSKIRGTSKTELKGYESDYYINEVPQKLTEYKKFIGELLNEETFKLITNPVYFSSLHWTKRKEIIMQIAGNLSNLEVLKQRKELEPLREHLEKYTADEFSKVIKSKIFKMKDDRDELPVRIDEANKSIQEYEFETLEREKIELRRKIDEINEKINDKSKVDEEFYKLKSELVKKESELGTLNYSLQAESKKASLEIEDEINSSEYKLKRFLYNAEILKNDKNRSEKELNNLKITREQLLSEYKEIKERTFKFDEESCICPTCKRKLEIEDIEKTKQEMFENFNLKKAADTASNITKGKQSKEDISELENEIIDFEKEIVKNNEAAEKEKENLKTLQEKREILNMNTKIVKTDEIITKEKEIESLNLKIKNFKADDLTEIKTEKRELENQLQEINSKLSYKNINSATRKRITELETEETNLSETIAEFEGLQMLLENFVRTKVKLMEENINSKFKYVKFKMFKNQINGGLEECCEPCVDGVPFATNLNTAARINAGLDIINTLCRHYEVNAPIFVDNRESVNKLIETDSQIINLIVSKDKTLKVEVI